MDRVLAGAAALLGVVTSALPVWTRGTVGEGDAPAVRRYGLWREEWSGFGGGDSATTAVTVDAGGVVLLLAALVLAAAVASRAPAARLTGVVAAVAAAVVLGRPGRRSAGWAG